MKIRLCFVSNSSSSSFVLKKENLSPKQIKLIKDHKNSGEEYADSDPWVLVKNNKDVLSYCTCMNNFDFIEYLQKLVFLIKTLLRETVLKLVVENVGKKHEN